MTCCCGKPGRSEKERLKEGAAMTPCDELAAYMCGCEEGPAGKDDASEERATCILRGGRGAMGGGRRPAALRFAHLSSIGAGRGGRGSGGQPGGPDRSRVRVRVGCQACLCLFPAANRAKSLSSAQKAEPHGNEPTYADSWCGCATRTTGCRARRKWSSSKGQGEIIPRVFVPGTLGHRVQQPQVAATGITYV